MAERVTYRGHIETIGIAQSHRYINALSEMPRWESYPTPMIHRTSLYVHRERTKAIAGNIIYFAIEDPTLPELVSLDFLSSHHDDHEIIDTDKPSPLKEYMTPEEKHREALQEMASFEIVGRKYLHLEGAALQKYINAMACYQEKSTLVAQVVDVADKLDAIGETLHEMRCGNTGFVDAYEYYRNRKFRNFERYPFWEKLKKDPALAFDPLPTAEELFDMPRLTVDSLATRDSLKYDAHDSSLPAWYKSWLGISYQLFNEEPQPEFHIFPGWRNELRLRWNYMREE